jgi:hypothetical protein
VDDEQLRYQDRTDTPAYPLPVADRQGRTSTLLLVGALVLVLLAGGAGFLLERSSGSATGSGAAAVATAGDTSTPTGNAGGGSTGGGGTASPGPQGFATYTNPRFGFRTLYPADFTAQTQSSNGDGMEWVGGTEGTTTVTAYGANTGDGTTPDEELTTLSDGIDVTYSHVKGDVVTVSGFKDGGDTVVYIREVVGPGSSATLQWTYPAADKGRWDAAVAATAAAFRPGDLSTGH